MVPQSLTDRTIRGVLWMFSGAALQALLSLMVLMVLARLLTPTDFGVVGAALIVVSLAQATTQIGIGPAIVQRPQLSRAHIQSGFAVSVIVASSVCFVIIATAEWIGEFFRMPALVAVLQTIALVFPLAGASIVAHALLQREMRFKQLAGIETISYAVGYGAVGIFLAAMGYGVWALVFAQIGQTTTALILLLLSKKEALGFSLHPTELRQLLTFGAGFSLARIANYLATHVDNVVVGRWLGPEQLGIYGRAYQLLMMPANLFGTVIDRVLFPVMGSIQQDQSKLRRAFMNGIAVIALLTLPISGILVVLAPEIVTVLLGEQWLDVIVPFQIFSLILMLRTSYKLGHSLSRALGAVYATAWRQWVYAAAVLAGAWLGHFSGLTGVAVGVAMAIAINYVLTLHLSLKLIGGSWGDVGVAHFRSLSIGSLVGLTVLGLKTVIAAHGASPIWVLLGASSGAALMLVFLWITCRGIFGEEGVWLRSNFSRQLGLLMGRSI